MINILAYLGMSLQSEVCLWTLLGLVRTIFDATLFKVNANLKQVWQMSMPEELSLSVQRGLRTMISGIMLVQCFTVYVYLASYIVLLYPVFLEERPVLVLPWLLLAAIRKLLCELTSLALGLGTCVLLGPARPPCIKFVVIKVISIMPSFYMWMLVHSYYNALKVASVFKSFSSGLPPSELDYGLELAVRRRRAKSLLGEDQLRRKLISNCYTDNALQNLDIVRNPDYSARIAHPTKTDAEEVTEGNTMSQQRSTHSSRLLADGLVSFEDWFGHEVGVPRDSDRVMEQFGVMMLRISAYITKEGTNSQFFSQNEFMENRCQRLNCAAMPPDHADTPPLVGSSNARTASYLRDYPQIFMKKPDISLSLAHDNSIVRQSKSNTADKDDNDIKIYRKWSHSIASNASMKVDAEVPTSTKRIGVCDSKERKKVQNKLSDKCVSFTQHKRSSSSASDIKNKNTKISDADKINLNKALPPDSTDSLQSIIDDVNSRAVSYMKNLKKDEILYKTKGTSSEQNVNNLSLKTSSTCSILESDDVLTFDKATSTKPEKDNSEKKKK